MTPHHIAQMIDLGHQAGERRLCDRCDLFDRNTEDGDAIIQGLGAGNLLVARRYLFKRLPTWRIPTALALALKPALDDSNCIGLGNIWHRPPLAAVPLQKLTKIGGCFLSG